MSSEPIQTERLILRQWRDADRAAFARINADPEVMRYFPNPLSRAESDALIDRIQGHFTRKGYGLWALELRKNTGPETGHDDAGDDGTSQTDEDSACIGFTGLYTASFDAHFTPTVEIGWRLAAEDQGRGYATEAARAALAFAFDELRLPEVVSFTSILNTPSRRVMEKIGLVHTPADDFDHPALPPGHRLRRHVLYRLQNPRPL